MHSCVSVQSPLIGQQIVAAVWLDYNGIEIYVIVDAL